jgi:hypothetical protein
MDLLVLGQDPVVPLCIMKARPIGVMDMIDRDQEDAKIIAVHAHDPSVAHFQDISELPQHTLDELRRFFEDYKKLEHDASVTVERFLGRRDASHARARRETLRGKDRPSRVTTGLPHGRPNSFRIFSVCSPSAGGRESGEAPDPRRIGDATVSNSPLLRTSPSACAWGDCRASRGPRTGPAGTPAARQSASQW